MREFVSIVDERREGGEVSFSRGTRNNLTVIYYIISDYITREREWNFTTRPIPSFSEPKKKSVLVHFFGIGVTRGSVQLVKKRKKRKKKEARGCTRMKE